MQKIHDSGEYTEFYIFDETTDILYPPTDEFTPVEEAEKRIAKYRKSAYAVARTLERDNIAVFATEEIDFDAGIVTKVCVYDPPVVMSAEEYADTFKVFKNTIVYWLTRAETIKKDGREYVERYIAPCTFREASDFIKRYHRHNDATTGYKFAIGLYERDSAGSEYMIGVVVVGHPNAIETMLREPLTAEILRLCIMPGVSDNACSILYAAAGRTAQSMGYTRLISYTLESEQGTSLRASSFRLVKSGCGGAWTGERAARNRRKNPDKKIPTEKKNLWERHLAQKVFYAELEQ